VITSRGCLHSLNWKQVCKRIASSKSIQK
jgi:hypothetical protein